MLQVRQSASPAGVSVLVFAGIAILLVFAKVLLIPLAFALTLSFLLVPAVANMEKRGIRRIVAVALTTSLTCAVLLIATYLLSLQVLHVAQTLPEYRANIQKKIEALHPAWEDSLNAATVMLEDMSGRLASNPSSPHGDTLAVRIVGPRSDDLRSTMGLIAAILEPIGQLGIVLIFTTYILVNREDLRHRLLLLAGIRNINQMTRALDDATRRMSQYLLMQFEVNACYGLLFGVGLYALNVPEAALWGAIAGVLRIVPFLGTLLGMLAPLLLSIALSSSWWPPLLVLALFLFLELTVAYLLEPWLFSSRTGISSLALLASAIFWSMLWGWPGLVLATPLTMCVVVLGQYVPQLSFLNTLLGANAKLSPAGHLYERLLAMDQNEAWAIAERYLSGKPLVKLYDSVIVPVLSLAEEDRHRGALNDVQAKFVLLSIGELVARLTAYREVSGEADDRSARSILIDALREPLQKKFAVVCVASEDAADLLTNVMLGQLLERQGYQTLTLPAEALSEEILHGLATEPDTVVVISSLPPFAFAQARLVCKRLRTLMPENRIAVGFWNSETDGEEMLERFGTARPNIVLGTMAQMLTQVGAWRRGTRVR